MARILIVDDDDAIRALVAKLFTRRGMDVVTASDGEEAVAQLQAGDFDLLVLDLMLPRLDGIGVLEHIAAAKISTPVILMTAAAPGIVRQVPKDQVRKIITKPFDLSLLLAEAEEAMAARPVQD
jgi:CheY-like chemotaxis protein